MCMYSSFLNRLLRKSQYVLTEIIVYYTSLYYSYICPSVTSVRESGRSPEVDLTSKFG